MSYITDSKDLLINSGRSLDYLLVIYYSDKPSWPATTYTRKNLLELVFLEELSPWQSGNCIVVEKKLKVPIFKLKAKIREKIKLEKKLNAQNLPLVYTFS